MSNVSSLASVSGNWTTPEASLTEEPVSPESSTADSSPENSLRNENFSELPENLAYATEALFEGSELSICGAVMAIMKFCLANHLSYKATDELLKLLHLLCPAPNKLPQSVYFLKKFFKHFKTIK